MIERRFGLALEDLVAYSNNCRALLKETLLSYRPLFDKPIQPPLSVYQSIRRIAAHMIGAEEFWIRHRINKEELTRYETRSAESLEELFEDWESVRRGTTAYIDSLSPGEFERIYPLELRGWRGELSVRQILFHILNHEVHHRAQISMALQQFGVEPPDFDFVFLS